MDIGARILFPMTLMFVESVNLENITYMKSFLVILSMLLSGIALGQVKSVYDFTLPSNNSNDSIQLSNYRGQKILIVNSATITSSVSQLSALENLNKQFKDSSLIIIVCPSNSFGNETGSDQEILQYINLHFSPSFLISRKINVVGSEAHPLFKWIASKEQNSVLNYKIRGDYNKILVNRQGKIVGVFAENVLPDNEILIKTIVNN